MDQPQCNAESMRNTHSPRGEKSADSSWTHRGRPQGDEYSRIERRFCALRKVRLRTNRSVIQSLCGVPQPRRRKIRRFFVDVFEDESSKIERRFCALRKVNLWTKETAGRRQCQGSYWSQSGTLVRWSFLNYNSASQLHADLLAQLPGLGDRAFAKG